MKRDVCKFFAGAFAALAFGHARYAVWVSRGRLNKPIWRGREWKTEYMWAEAAAYSVVSLALAYCGWFRKSQVKLQAVREPAQAAKTTVTTLGEQTATTPENVQ